MRIAVTWKESKIIGDKVETRVHVTWAMAISVISVSQLTTTCIKSEKSLFAKAGTV